MAVDTLCEVSVFLEGVEQPPIHMDMKGRVGLSTDQELAVEFKEVDLEGYKHLKSGSLQLAPIRRCRLQRIR